MVINDGKCTDSDHIAPTTNSQTQKMCLPSIGIEDLQSAADIIKALKTLVWHLSRDPMKKNEFF